MGMRLLLLPVVAAVSFETLMLLAKWENWLTKAFRWPGMQLQALTTREPDDSMLEVSIAAFADCLNEEERENCMPPVAAETEAPAEEAAPSLCEQVAEEAEADAAAAPAEHDGAAGNDEGQNTAAGGEGQ
jgi:hypothetical protein